MTTRKRDEADTPRERFLYTDVTEEEYETIVRYCRKEHISISQFLADLLLQEANKSHASRQDKYAVKIDLTPAEHEKLELLTRLHHKGTIGDYIRELLEPELRLQRVHRSAKTKHIRYYFSDQEYKAIIDYLNGAGLSARNYPVILALNAIQKRRKKKQT
ncbi:MAG TPA: hypothetical protein VI636_09680 [Candidatus Angelobacter sp.]